MGGARRSTSAVACSPGLGFADDLAIVDLEARTGTVAEDDFTPEAEIWNALVLGVRDARDDTAMAEVFYAGHRGKGGQRRGRNAMMAAAETGDLGQILDSSVVISGERRGRTVRQTI